jgi:hypothetical protein
MVLGVVNLGADLLYLLATRAGLLNLVAVITSLYPGRSSVTRLRRSGAFATRDPRGLNAGVKGLGNPTNIQQTRAEVGSRGPK